MLIKDMAMSVAWQQKHEAESETSKSKMVHRQKRGNLSGGIPHHGANRRRDWGESVYVEWIARRKFSKHGALVLPHSTKRKEERKPIT